MTLRKGEIHALLGENGAGKTTLVSVASGRFPADAGEILRDGSFVFWRSPKDARRLGVALVAQHDLLADAATVAENLALLDPAVHFLESRKTREARVSRAAQLLGLELPDPWVSVGSLGVGTRQRVEIAGALLSSPSVLILDEPTAVLSPGETSALFAALRRRAELGTAVVLITHRLAEVFEAAQSVTLLSRGKTLLESDIGGVTPEDLAGLILAGSREPAEGDESQAPESPMKEPSEHKTVLSMRSFVPSGSSAPPLDLSLGAGELEVLLSIDGNGAGAIAAAIAGIRGFSGVLTVGGGAIPPEDPVAFRLAGGAYVPPDRRNEGLFLNLSVDENIALVQRRRRFWLQKNRTRGSAQELVRSFGIRVAGVESPAWSLSGGNQQKLLVARALSTLPCLLVAVHPGRGLDIASAGEIRQLIEAARAKGTAVLLVTSDPDAAIEYKAPIRVVYRGRVSERLPFATPLLALGQRMAGLGW